MRKYLFTPSYDQFTQELILPVVLYGCETFSLTLREEHRLRVFKNRVLRRIYGPKRDEVTGGLKKLRNEYERIIFFGKILVL
jgi:hypothetical protein